MIITAVTVLLIIIHVLLFPTNNEIFFNTVSTFLFTIFPGVLCIQCIRDYNLLFRKFVLASYVVSVINVGVFILLLLGKFAGSVYSMGFSDALVFPTNAIIAYCLRTQNRKGNFFGVLLIGINCLTIVLFGSRGSLAAIVAFFTLVIIKRNFRYEAKSIISSLLLVVFAIILILFSNSIIHFVIAIFDSIGISSRSLQLLLQNEFFSNNGRIDIWRTIWEGIMENPLQMRGINADQLLKTGFYHTSNYSHNLFLELMYSFGIIIGGLLSILFCAKIYNTYKQDNIDDRGIIELLLLSPFFPNCLWSGSLWINLYCWLWIGLNKDRNATTR